MTDKAAMKVLLEKRREGLMQRIGESRKALTAEHSKDWEDQAIERESDDVWESLGVADRNELNAIEAALARIEDGTYGECVECGDEISEARLMILPQTPLCRRCASPSDNDVDAFDNVPV